MKKYKILIIFIALLMLSATFNVVLYNKSKKYERYERTVDNALSYFTFEYRVGSIHRSLTNAISEKKLYFGEQGKFNNYFQREFQQLSIMHRELTLLYGPINSYDEYSNISSIGTNNLFNMFVDFSVFFKYLGDTRYDSIASDTEGQYINLSDLNDETLNGIQIVAEITGKLESIRSRSYENKTSNDKKALEDYMLKSAEYFNTQEVQEKVEVIENINKKLISQTNS